LVNEIDSVELQGELKGEKPPLLYDIRSEMEVARGVLPRAEHLPMHLIPVKINDLPKDRSVVLYCHSGARSYHACRYLMQQGYDNVVNLRGGILDWARNGFEVTGLQS
jgi:rhodanese-related sulfurtransferase